MARNESDREDLMAEATSLIQRIEIQYSEIPAVLGVNNLDWLFIYLGQDIMYRFDERGRLRRAFVAGTLYRTAGQTLSALIKQRTGVPGNTDVANESYLLRRDLSVDELRAFQDDLRERLTVLAHDLNAPTILRQHPPEAEALPRHLQQRVVQVLESPEFLAPAIVRR
jgi:hypothetical protein